MKKNQDYVRDIAEIRSMMERSSKFLSLSGWAGILAGTYALAGAFIAYYFLDFNPVEIVNQSTETPYLAQLIGLAFIVLILAAGTAIFLSYKRAHQREEKPWNITAKRLLINMAVPLVAGGLLVLIMISKGLIGLMALLTLVFYGLALYNAGTFTYKEVKILGLVQLGLGLASTYFIHFSLLLCAIGFGLVHIIYGIYMHYKYER